MCGKSAPFEVRRIVLMVHRVNIQNIVSEAHPRCHKLDYVVMGMRILAYFYNLNGTCKEVLFNYYM